jgi:hypothetical protein
MLDGLRILEQTGKTLGRRQPNEGEADMAFFTAQLARTSKTLSL